MRTGNIQFGACNDLIAILKHSAGRYFLNTRMAYATCAYFFSISISSVYNRRKSPLVALLGPLSQVYSSHQGSKRRPSVLLDGRAKNVFRMEQMFAFKVHAAV